MNKGGKEASDPWAARAAQGKRQTKAQHGTRGPHVVAARPATLPQSVAIAHLRGVYMTDYGMLMAGTLVSIAPVLLLFLLPQREFIAGLTSGAVKG